MTLNEISNFRLTSQKVEKSEFTSPQEIVSWMGAMQAQDYLMAKWAVGIRLLNSTDDTIVNAFNKGEIIRTHLMRPTWHFVSANDVYWMLELTAPQIKPLTKTRDKQLELTEEIFAKSNKVIERALANGVSLTREELTEEFHKVKIKTDNNRLSHLLLRAELDGLVCSGPIKGNKHTHSLLCNRVPNKKMLTRDEALAELAMRYFTSHYPATLRDFVWWSGLSVSDARKALDYVKSNFISETIGTETYWFTNSSSNTHSDKATVHLLPAFDEFLISYKDRSASLSFIHNKKTIFDNGIFRPVIVVNDQVIGLWKRTTNKAKVIVDVYCFQPQNKSLLNTMEKAVLSFGSFLGKETELNIN
jgi:hypothetical protein